MTVFRAILFGGPQDGGLYDVPNEADGSHPPKIRIAAPVPPAQEVLQDILGDDVEIYDFGQELEPDLIYRLGRWSKDKKDRETLPVPYIFEPLSIQLQAKHGGKT